MLSHLKILFAFQFKINRYPRADGATNGEKKIKICLHPGNQCSATFRISLFTNRYWAVKAQMGNLSGEEYRFALENTSLSTEPTELFAFRLVCYGPTSTCFILYFLSFLIL